MRATKINKRPLVVYNACKDVTEADIVRQRYYKLMAEQAVWNATKQAPKKSIFGLFSF